MSESDEDRPPRARGLYLEDAVILVSIGALFVLTVFFRHTPGGKLGLVLLLALMLVVFVRRLTRVHKAFRGPQ